MAYQKTKPLATDRLKDSQSDLQNNFIYLQDNWEVNHGSFNTSNAYKNKFAQFITQTVIPANAGGSDPVISSVYNSKLGSTDIYFNKLPVTANRNNPQQGWAYLPCGLVLKWGFNDLLAGTNTAIVFNTSVVNGPQYPVYSTEPWAIMCTAVNSSPTNNMAIVVTQVDGAPHEPTPYSPGEAFAVWCASAVTCYWMTLGSPAPNFPSF